MEIMELKSRERGMINLNLIADENDVSGWRFEGQLNEMCSQKIQRKYVESDALRPKNLAPTTLGDQGSPTGKGKRKPSLLGIKIPFVDYCKATMTTINLINRAWKQNRIDVVKYLHIALDSAENPYALSLYLAVHSPDFMKELKEDSLAFYVISGLGKWLTKSDIDIQERKHLTPEIQEIAFEMFTLQKNSSLLRLAFSVYRLETMTEKFIARIKKLCEEKQFVEACICAGALDLHSHFTIHDFVFPLITQSRDATALNFLSGSKEKQTEILQFLDELISNFNLGNFIVDYVRNHKIPEAKMERLYKKPLETLLKRLMAKFEADPKICPYIKKKQERGSLYYLLNRKYSEDVEMSEESFMELLQDTVGDDFQLQSDAMREIVQRGDRTTAANFAIRLEIPSKRIPVEIREVIRELNSKISLDSSVSVSQDDLESKTFPGKNAYTQGLYQTNVMYQEFQKNKKYYSLPISEEEIPEKVKIVATKKEMDDFMGYIDEQVENTLPNYIVAGLDAEWKPMSPEFPGAAVVQVAFGKVIYILDVVQLRKSCLEHTEDEKSSEDIWNSFKSCFLGNKKILKVSYDIKNDLRKLGQTVPQWRDIKSEFQSCVDLRAMEHEILRKDCSFFPYNEDPSCGTGLSELVRLCLGHPVNKEEQFSNWERRPLRPSQIIYAATDVYCLLEVFDFLIQDSKNRREEMHENIHNFINMQLIGGKSPCAEITTETRDIKDQVDVAVADCEKLAVKNHGAKNISFVCDKMLHPLGKKLRACGLDTLIISNDKTELEYLRILPKNPNRYFLTRGLSYDQIIGYISPSQAYKVISESAEEQLKEILSFFNITLAPEDLFSRCHRCNTIKFIQVTGETMRKILANLAISKTKDDHQGKSSAGMITCSDQWGKTVTKKWLLFPTSHMNITKGLAIKTPSNAVVEIDKVPQQPFQSIQNFYICDFCGKCYWDNYELDNQLFL